MIRNYAFEYCRIQRSKSKAILPPPFANQQEAVMSLKNQTVSYIRSSQAMAIGEV